MPVGTAGRLRLFRYPAAALAGAIGACGQAPIDVPLAMLVALALGFVLWRSEAARPGLIGWSFGLGYFAVALVWIIEPFQVDPDRHGWMAPFALLLLSGGLALFWGAAFWLARRLSQGALALVAAWTGAEILRAYALTGFPWASPAQVTIDGPASVLLAWGGPHLATAVLMALAGLLSSPAPQGRALPMRLGQGALLVAGGLALSLPQARTPAGMTDHWVRLVQPNVAQRLKWNPELAELFFDRKIALTATPAQAGQAPALIVWPETAIPWRLETAGPLLARVAQAAQGVPVALGALRYEGETLRNSLAVVGPQGTVVAIYDKHHLVPFGEYVPLGGLADRLGLQALASSMGGFSSGPGPALLDFGRLGTALPLICYEAVFAHLVNDPPARPDFLLQITNDAWFGAYAGPQQHLAQARMRAIEQGLPLMRAANTGISAMIDPTGRVLSALALNEAGVIDAALPQPLPPTLYSRLGDWPAIVLVVFALLVFRIMGRGRDPYSD